LAGGVEPLGAAALLALIDGAKDEMEPAVTASSTTFFAAATSSAAFFTAVASSATFFVVAAFIASFSAVAVTPRVSKPHD
jgi:hypothetical protein